MGNKTSANVENEDDEIGYDVSTQMPWKEKENPRKYQTPQELEIEKRWLENSGIPYDEFRIENIVVDEEGNYVRTF